MSDSKHTDTYQPEDNLPEQVKVNENSKTGLIGYFAHNPVAANLLMVLIFAVGIASYFTIQRQMFPSVEINYINVRAVYPGASPQEIEESVMIKIEESLKDVTEIKRTVARSFRNSGSVSLEIDSQYDLGDVLDKVKLRVDGISGLPVGLEPLIVYQVEFQQPVIQMALTADMPVLELKPLARSLEKELLQLDNVSLARMSSPDDEIGIEIDPEVLREYGLTIYDVTRAINQYSTNASAGQLRTGAGLVSIRVENQYYTGVEFRKIPVKIGENGAKVLLGDIADIKDGFTEGLEYFKFNDKNAIYFQVNATKDQSIGNVANSVKSWMEVRNETLPPGVKIEKLVDFTYYLDARLKMMLKNMLMGAVLVAIMLGVFLRARLAFWVMVGLPVCFLGALTLMPFFGVTINVVSLFAFIMVLGIVVDDAIVIGESVYSEIEKKGAGGVHNVVMGARRVATPATFGVLTTIAVFAPFVFSSGPESAFFKGIAVVTIACLIFSLIESKLILPAHLAHTPFSKEKTTGWRANFNRAFHAFVNTHYRRFVSFCVEWRWPTFATFTGVMILAISLLSSNLVRFIPMPSVPEDFPNIYLEMNETVSDEQTIDALKGIEAMVKKVNQDIIDEFGVPLVENILVFNEGRTQGQVLVSLVDEDKRVFSALELSERWRAAMPDMAGVKSLVINDKVGQQDNNDGDFGYLIYGADFDTLDDAGRKMVEELQKQTGLYNISSTLDPAGKEIQLSLLPVAYDLGINLSDLASQLGANFYGGEAQRVIRDGEELKIMVRYPELTRQSFASLKYSLIKTPTGKEVMLGDIAELTEKPGISYVRRQDGYRSVYVYGNIDNKLIEPSEANKNIYKEVIPEVLKLYPSIKTELGGGIKEDQDQLIQQLLFFVVGMLVVYILLAIPLKSYSQPFIVMSVIPFGMIGAVVGHFIVGMDMSMFSLFGLIAASGVVINDSLVMTDFVNQMRRQGVAIKDAVIEAGCARFRAITLTSITTFAGVMPIMFETSTQAKFVIPMAVSLGFSILFATLITLVLVPCLYLIFGDIGKVLLAHWRQIVRSAMFLVDKVRSVLPKEKSVD